tara:strand:+ start:900 stop:1985 length:1086 start_codon:yes stop_codon:yes gene_type:complete
MISSKKDLAIVVLFWNDYEKTIKCLNSLYKQKKQKFSLVLVDNNSEGHYTSKIFNWLEKKKIKKISINKNKVNEKLFGSKKVCFYLKNKSNYGCGLGHNFGYKFCLKNNFKYIARIDNDMVVPKFVMYNLVNRMKKNSYINALSPKIMFFHKPKMIWFRGAEIGNNLKFQRNTASYSPKGHNDNKSFKGLINTDAVAGCASIMKSSKLRKTNLSDPDFFYGEEDTELSTRLKDNKDSLKVDLNQKIYHHVSSTVGKNWAKNIYYNYKYRLVLIKKIGTFFDKFFGYSFSIVKLFLSLLLIFKIDYSSKILQRFYALKHFYQKKYGSYDRINYKRIDNFFSDINKKTNFIYLLKKINNNYKY